MIRSRSALVTAAALLLALGCGWSAAALAADSSTTTLCQEQTAPVSDGTYTVQNNEYDSSASECVSTDGGADFTVANSSIDNSTDGSPGAYPSIYQGCHWGNCSTGGLSTDPVEVSNLTTGAVTTSWSTTQTGTGDYDVAYDIWFNQTPTTAGQPNGSELMVWLNHNGPVQPFGSEVASNVTLGGHTYDVWEGSQSSWDTITYEMTSPATSVSGLDVGTLAQDMVSRGYTKSSWYLIDVEASFAVNINGGTSSPPPSPSSSPSPSTTAPSTASCSGTYSVVSSWSDGFQGQVVVKNTGTTTLNSWQLGWTFPGNQAIEQLWNGNSSQSSTNVTVTNASYNGQLAPGASTTVGFLATYSGSNTAPSSVSCT
jgi:hypothetical protein